MKIYKTTIDSLKQIVELDYVAIGAEKEDIKAASVGMLLSMLDSGGIIVDDSTTKEDIAEYISLMFRISKDDFEVVLKKMFIDKYVYVEDFVNVEGELTYMEEVVRDKEGDLHIEQHFLVEATR